MPTRRDIIAAGALGTGALILWPGLTFAATGQDARFLFVLLRGGLDGLEAVPPHGDPGYPSVRGTLALSTGGANEAGTAAAYDLDGTFALHPSLRHAADLYARGEFMPLVATAPPYWGRSHFDAQDCLENGTDAPHAARTGWLNRAVAAAPGVQGLAIAAVMPLTMRGPAKVSTWSPPLPNQVNPILLQRLDPLYAADPRLAEAFRRALATQPDQPDVDALRRQAAAASADAEGGAAADSAAADGAAAGAPQQPAMRRDAGNRTPAKANAGRLPLLMAAAGDFMRKPDGPRIAFVEDTGWDTHANEAAILRGKLAELDAALEAYRGAMGETWRRTVVAVATEFGRTAAVNGTGGTDHGTGGTMFLAGGAVRGGRVAGRWPGMGRGELYENRDIHATTDSRAVFKGLLAEHLGLTEAALASSVFPGSAGVEPLAGLVAGRTGRRGASG